MRLRVMAAGLWTIIILVLCWTPQIYMPVGEGADSVSQQLHIDKFVHAGFFAVFAFLWLRVAPGCRSRYLWVVLAGAALGVITEVVQNVPIINREGEFGDFLADLAGVLFGFPLYRWVVQHGKRKRDPEETGPEVAARSSG